MTKFRFGRFVIKNDDEAEESESMFVESSDSYRMDDDETLGLTLFDRNHLPELELFSNIYTDKERKKNEKETENKKKTAQNNTKTDKNDTNTEKQYENIRKYINISF